MLPTLRLTGIVVPDGEAFHAYCPELPGCHTYGETVEQAWAMLDDAVRLVVNTMKEAGEPLPEGPAHRRELTINA